MIKCFTDDTKFCKIIDEECLRNDDLMITALSREFWDDISSPICLKLPDGCTWLLHWKQHDDTHVLLNKWKRFAEAYSLKHNQVLLFKYVDNSYPISKFRVSIFDQTGTEIGYPTFCSVFSPWETKTTKPAVPTRCSILHPPKKIKTNPKQEDPKGSGSTPSQMTKPKNRGTREVPYNTRGSSTINQSVALEEDIECSSRAFERAKATVSCLTNNPYFIRQMRPSYIQRNVLALPPNFLTTHQLTEEDESALLLISKHKHWNVKLKLNTCNGQIISFHAGWKNFVTDNKLKLGDVCLFELLKSTGTLMFRVHIFRAREQSSPPHIQGHTS